MREVLSVPGNGRAIKPAPSPLSADLAQMLQALSEIRWNIDALEDRLLDIAVKVARGGVDGRP
jgi:hypothetical protein